MKRKTKRVPKRRPVKPLANPAFNIHHEDLAPKIEKAFKSGAVQYYKFIEDHQIPAGRYKYIYAALKEADLRMSLETLQNYVGEIKKVLNGGDKKNLVSMEQLWRITLNLENRLSLAFEPASVKRLAAVIYFDETEDLKTYDKRHGAQKVEFWEKNNTMDFFLTRPIVELFGLKNISITSLEEYIQTSEGIIQDLTLDLQIQSSANSSVNGNPTS
jgi:hypothetical protein